MMFKQIHVGVSSKRVPFFRHAIWRARTSLTSVRTSKKSASSEGSEPGDLVNQGIPGERQIDVEAMASWPPHDFPDRGSKM